MKKIILTLIITSISTLSNAMDSRVNESHELAYGRLGMDKFSTHDGVQCNSELNKSLAESLGNASEKSYARGIRN